MWFVTTPEEHWSVLTPQEKQFRKQSTVAQRERNEFVFQCPLTQKFETYRKCRQGYSRIDAVFLTYMETGENIYRPFLTGVELEEHQRNRQRVRHVGQQLFYETQDPENHIAEDEWGNGYGDWSTLAGSEIKAEERKKEEPKKENWDMDEDLDWSTLAGPETKGNDLEEE